jgi:hypothetical protein
VHGDGGTCTQSGLCGAAGGKRLRHEPQQGLHHEHPRRTANLPGMVESSISKRGRQAMKGVELTGARQRCWAAPVVGEAGHASGSCSEVIECSDDTSGSYSEVGG